MKLLVLLMWTVLALPRVAHADQPGAHTVPVAVLAFDSEDSEEQADAITGAVRSRVRAAAGWSLIETTQSLGMLTAAMKCPSRPTPECQQRIADQIKAERYIYGFVSKGPQPGQVTAEIHLYQKGKADAVLKESYADNLKDSNDDTLRKIAGRIVERLGGNALGVVIVQSNEQTGEIIVDGEKHAPLAQGTARIELAAGGHSIELAPTGGAAVKRNVLVTAGHETVVEFTPQVAAATGGNAVKTRKIVGGAAMGVGAVLGVIAVVEALKYASVQSDGEAYAKTQPNAGKPCRETGNAVCVNYDKDSKVASALAWTLGGASLVGLGVGAFLFFGGETSASESNKAAVAPKPKARIVPQVGTSSGGVTVLGTF